MNDIVERLRGISYTLPVEDQRLLNKAADEIERLRAENEMLRYERDQAHHRLDGAVRLLTGIHSLLYPAPINTENGQTMVFRPKDIDPHEVLQKLSDRIRQLEPENERLHGESEATAEYGCFIDYNRHGEDPYPDCELDKGTPNQCTFADALHACGKGKEACKYWRRVK